MNEKHLGSDLDDFLAEEGLLDDAELVARKRVYSFIGIGRSDKGNLSTEVDKILAEAANRREGWSLPE
jgi:hypothetical protein